MWGGGDDPPGGRSEQKRPASPGDGQRAATPAEKKKRKTEAQKLAFESPGPAQSVPEPAMTERGVRTTRSGKRVPLPSAEELEREDVFVMREGSRAERALDLAKQLGHQVAPAEYGDGSEHADDSGSGLNASAVLRS